MRTYTPPPDCTVAETLHALDMERRIAAGIRQELKATEDCRVSLQLRLNAAIAEVASLAEDAAVLAVALARVTSRYHEEMTRRRLAEAALEDARRNAVEVVAD